MLKEFLLDAAGALAASGHEMAGNIAELLGTIDIEDGWQVSRQSPVLGFLTRALEDPLCHSAARRIGPLAGQLAWRESVHDMPASISGIYCFVVIVGPGGMIADDRFRFGIYLQRPDTFYPAHRHEAEELYFPLSGTALWQTDNADFKPVASGTVIHHKPYQSHATRTLAEPLLALWAWTGNLSLDTYSIVTDHPATRAKEPDS